MFSCILASEASFVSVTESIKPDHDTDSSIASDVRVTTDKQQKVDNVNTQIKSEDVAKIFKVKIMVDLISDPLVFKEA